jgi:hypothetical protein
MGLGTRCESAAIFEQVDIRKRWLEQMREKYSTGGRVTVTASKIVRYIWCGYIS